MLSERLILRVRGFVRFSVKGGFTAQFLSLCNQKKIRLMQMKNSGDAIQAVVFRKDFENTAAIAQHSGMTLTVLCQKGMPFLIRRYRLRWGIPVGLFLGLVLLGLLSSMVWQVQINGCENISEEYIRTFFEEMGVRPGVFQTQIDIHECRDRALTQIESLSWVSLYFKGCIACIEVRERAPTTELPQQECSNLIASYAGEIIRADVYAGHSYVKIGQAVAQGDLLVGGGVMLKNGAFRLVNAKADIEARTQRTLSVSIPMQKETQYIEKATNVKKLYWFGLQIPLGFCGTRVKSESCQSLLNANGVIFPVGLTRVGCRKTAEKTIETGKNIALLQAFTVFAIEQLQTMQGKRIVSREVAVRQDKNTVCVQADYICEENICTVKELYYDDESQRAE